jgi:hypothetical protein
MGRRQRPAPVVGPAPEAFISDLLLGEHGDSRLWRPALDRAFMVGPVEPPLDPELVWRALRIVQDLMRNRVGFVPCLPGRAPEISFVWNPYDPSIVAQGAIACTYQTRTTADVMIASRIVWGRPEWLPSIKVWLHELGHAMGLCHAYSGAPPAGSRCRGGWGPRFIMGAAPDDQDAFDAWEQQAVDRSLAAEPGALAASAGPPQRLHVCGLAEIAA